MINKFGIVVLHVQDIEKVKRFYSETVGLAIDPEQSEDHFVYMPFHGSTALALQAAPEASSTPSHTEIGFQVDDVDATYRKWQAQGVRLVSAPADLPFGRAFDAQDPDGNKVTIYKRPPVN